MTALRARRARVDIFCRLPGSRPIGLVDAASGLDDAPDERDVFLLDLAVVELTGELAMRRVILRGHHHARGAAIEPVHDPGAELSTDSTQVVHMVEQRVDEGAAGMPGRGVDDHSGGLVEHDHIGILIEDGEREVLRCRNFGWLRWQRDREQLARADMHAGT